MSPTSEKNICPAKPNLSLVRKSIFVTPTWFGRVARGGRRRRLLLIGQHRRVQRDGFLSARLQVLRRDVVLVRVLAEPAEGEVVGANDARVGDGALAEVQLAVGTQRQLVVLGVAEA